MCALISEGMSRESEETNLVEKSCDYGYFFDNLHFFSQRMVVDVIMLHEFNFYLALGLPDPQICLFPCLLSAV